MKAKFAELPRDYQEFILERETQRDTEFNRQVQEAAEKRNAANAELQAATQERRQYLTVISRVIGQLAQQTATEFADITSVADLEKLANDDPVRYLRWQARRDSLLAAQGEQEAALQREQAEQGQRYQSYLGEQRAKLLEKMPELKDPAKAKAISAESTKYLKAIGFDDQEISNVVDHRLMLVVRDALAYHAGRSAGQTAAEKKVVGIPRVTRPGAASERGERNAQDKAAMTSIARHGTTDQIAAAMTRLLESGT